MEEIKNKHNELIIKYPDLKEVLDPYFNSLIEVNQIQSMAFESVFNSIDKKIDLMIEGFFVSFQRSVNQELFLKIELKDLKKILKKGDSSKEIALNGFSDLLKINIKNVPEVYTKLLKGQIFQLIEKAVESGNFEDLADIENTAALIQYKGFVEKIDLSNSNNDKKVLLPPQPKRTKVEVLKDKLSEYGFFELEKIKLLSEQNQNLIINNISSNGLPYAIAMFDFLLFIPYLEKNHFDSKYKLNIEISKWFNSSKDGRAVKGNISSLLNNTTENKKRYTAHKHKETVVNDYEELK